MQGHGQLVPDKPSVQHIYLFDVLTCSFARLQAGLKVYCDKLGRAIAMEQSVGGSAGLQANMRFSAGDFYNSSSLLLYTF